eukprot:835530-Prorocentrum_minimum.AAC.2
MCVVLVGAPWSSLSAAGLACSSPSEVDSKRPMFGSAAHRTCNQPTDSIRVAKSESYRAIELLSRTTSEMNSLTRPPWSSPASARPVALTKDTERGPLMADPTRCRPKPSWAYASSTCRWIQVSQGLPNKVLTFDSTVSVSSRSGGSGARDSPSDRGRLGCAVAGF